MTIFMMQHSPRMQLLHITINSPLDLAIFVSRADIIAIAVQILLNVIFVFGYYVP